MGEVFGSCIQNFQNWVAGSVPPFLGEVHTTDSLVVLLQDRSERAGWGTDIQRRGTRGRKWVGDRTELHLEEDMSLLHRLWCRCIESEMGIHHRCSAGMGQRNPSEMAGVVGGGWQTGWPSTGPAMVSGREPHSRTEAELAGIATDFEGHSMVPMEFGSYCQNLRTITKIINRVIIDDTKYLIEK